MFVQQSCDFEVVMLLFTLKTTKYKAIFLRLVQFSCAHKRDIGRNTQLERHRFAVSRATGVCYYRGRRHEIEVSTEMKAPQSIKRRVDGVGDVRSEYIVTGSRFGSVQSQGCVTPWGQVRVMASVR